MAESMRSELSALSLNVSISDWTNSQDLHQTRSHIINAFILNHTIRGDQSRDQLRTILDSGWDVNEVLDIHDHINDKLVQRPALHEAASRGWTEEVKMLLDAGAKCVTSDILENPLVLALQNPECSPDLIKLLLKHGADPNDHDDQVENIPLLNAIVNLWFSQNGIIIVKLLLEHGANPNVAYRVNLGYKEVKWVHRTALHEAARRGWTKGVRMLLDAGANCVTSGTLETPLVLALQYDHCHPDLIKLLLKDWADDHDDQLGSFLNAIKQWCGYKQNATIIAQLLFDAGVKISRTLLNPLLEHRCSPELIELLLKDGVDVNDTVTGTLPLLHRMCTFHGDCIFLQQHLDLFFLHGCNINMEDDDHRTALEHFTSGDGHSNSVRWLIRHGADTALRFTLFKRRFMQCHGSSFPDTPLILLQAGMRVPHGVQRQLSNMVAAISTWLQDDTEETEEDGDVRRTVEGMWDQLEEAEREELQRVQCKLKKLTVPEYWTRQMLDLQELSDESLHVYPDVTCLSSTGDIEQEYQNLLDQIQKVLKFLSQPQSLQWHCRRCVRENLVSLQPSVVKTLPGPSRIKRFILCHEI